MASRRASALKACLSYTGSSVCIRLPLSSPSAGKFKIPAVTAEELSALQRDKHVVLVDVREPEEREVSMVSGAMTQAEFESMLLDHPADIIPGTVKH